MVTSGILQQAIEDAPNSLFPQCLATERPDQVVSFLVEGNVAILVHGDPWVLVVPTSFWAMMHTPEDSYLRWPYSTFVRNVRLAAILSPVLSPAPYVAAVNYHEEMIPTPLLMNSDAAWELLKWITVDPGWQQFLMNVELLTPCLLSLWDQWQMRVKSVAPPLRDKNIQWYQDALQNNYSWPAVFFKYNSPQVNTIIDTWIATSGIPR